MALVTLEGIATALDNLNAKPGTLRGSLVELLRETFADEKALNEITSISPDELVGKLWEVKSPVDLKAKRKNFSSLKSGLNKSLRDLDKKGKNPEGVTLGRDNVFIISDKRKDDLIKQIGLSGESPQTLHDMFSAFRELFHDMIKDKGVEEVENLIKELDETKKEIQDASGIEISGEEEAISGPGKGEAEAEAEGTGDDGGEAETLIEDEVEFIEEEELLAQGEEVAGADELEEVEILEENEFLEEEVQEGAGAALEEGGIGAEAKGEEELLLDEEEIELVEEEDELGLTEGELEGTGEEDEGELGLGGSIIYDDFEIIDDDELDELAEEEFSGMAGEEFEEEDYSEQLAATEDELEEILDEGEVEYIEEEETSAAALGETVIYDDFEVIDDDELDELAEEELAALAGEDFEDEDYTEVAESAEDELEEVLDEGEIEYVEEELAETEEIDEDELGALSEEVEELAEEVELVEDEGEEAFEDVEVLGEEELEEVEGGGDGGEETFEDVEILEDEELEEVEAAEDESSLSLEEKESEEIDADEVGLVEDEDLEYVDEPVDFLAEGEGETEDVELVGEDELEEIEGEDSDLLDTEELEEVSEEEVEVLDEDDFEEVEEIEGDGEEEDHKPSPLEVLSKYIEANEALAEEREMLHETQEEYISQILDRFMPKFIKIPAGQFTVGSSHPKEDEAPQRSVNLPSFFVGQIPVTNDLFDLFVRETGYVTDAEEAGYGIVYEGRCVKKIDPETGRETLMLSNGTTARHVSRASWRHPHGPGSSLEGKHNHPVVQVSHDDATAFAAWAGKRLPTEEEWEAVARGNKGQLFPWGNMWLEHLGNFESACLGDTSPVDSHGREAMSPFGIYDLLGNVFEWTATPYEKGFAHAQPSDIIYVLKGGCWTSSGTITAAHRRLEKRKYWANIIGFRCAV